MNFRPKQYYVPAKKKVEPEGVSYNVYHRKEDKSLGLVSVGKVGSHKEAILSVKELLVAEGDCLKNKAVLAVIKGGKNAN